MEFIEVQASQYPELAEKYAALGTLFDQKLWHQLSLELEAFVSDDSNIRGDNMLLLYKSFVSSCEGRMNQVKLATLISLIAAKLPSTAAALEFLQSVLLNSRSRLGAEAALCLDMDVVIAKMKLAAAATAAGTSMDTVTDECYSTAKDMLAAAKEQLPSIKSTESVAFSKFYKATAEFHKVFGPPNDFYNAALMFLAYTSVDDLTAEEKSTLATDMALASVTGDDIYNFGEVIATPILQCLKGTSNEWLQDLVLALNTGNVESFQAILSTYKDAYFAQPVLASKHELIQRKVVLLSLMNIAFERPSHDRQISFSDIAARTKVPMDQVEWYLMKAMAQGLIKGVIDEVDQTVNITWVQPRVLDKQQLGLLNEQLGEWTDKVKQALLTIEDQTAELYV